MHEYGLVKVKRPPLTVQIISRLHTTILALDLKSEKKKIKELSNPKLHYRKLESVWKIEYILWEQSTSNPSALNTFTV